MREILANQLWIGNAADARNVEKIMETGICAVLDLALEQMPPMLPRSLIYCRFPILDGGQNFPAVLRLAMKTLVSLLKREIPTLVCCNAGMSRSPAVAAGALAIFQGGNPDDRLRQIAAGHPHDVSPQLWQEVRNICREMT